MVFNIQSGDLDSPVTIPCGRCIGCRLERSRQWALRCVHEASLYDHNSFVTLTYDDKHLPTDGSLRKDHFQKFMKRLRRSREGTSIRYYMCGEYGEDLDQPSKLGRPHYHACLFGIDFNDKELINVRNEVKLYTSEELSRIWGKGFVTVGDLTFESAAYTARYIAKKIIGEKQDFHYYKLNYQTGELVPVIPEYNDMSRRPGVAAEWYEQFKKDTDKDYVTLRGTRMGIPRYYDKLLEKENPEHLETKKAKRKLEAWKHFDDNSPSRLLVKETCQTNRAKKLIRNLS